MRATRPSASSLDQSGDVVRGAFEHRLDAPVTTVSNPACDPAAQRRLPEGVPEVHTLHESVSYDALPLHSHILRDSWENRRKATHLGVKAVNRISAVVPGDP